MTKAKENTKVEIQVEAAKAKVISLTAEQQKKFEALPSVSAKIRYLAAEGYSTPDNKYGAIARFMNKRTQHVRNVLTQPLKKANS
tara:strand:+ start:329 stop:583 length:255 start_codon:yes stop_codon:yes gene_type:complete